MIKKESILSSSFSALKDFLYNADFRSLSSLFLLPTSLVNFPTRFPVGTLLLCVHTL